MPRPPNPTGLTAPLRRLGPAVALLAAVTILGGVGYWLLGAGRWTLFDGVYMALITISTVGFAELPGMETVPGAHGLTTGVIVAGLGAVAYFQSTLTAVLLEGTIFHVWRRNRMKNRIETLSAHVVVAGVGSTGRHVVEGLWATATPFVVIDRNHEHLDRVSREVCDGQMLFVHGDATEDATLELAGVARASGVIAALTNDKDNLFVTLTARGMSPHARIVAKVVEAEATAKMVRAGANATVSPNMIGGRRMVSELIRPEVVEFLDKMLRDKERNLRLEELTIPVGSPFAGKMLRDVPLRREANVLVVAARDPAREFRYNPGPEFILEGGSVLVVLGESLDVERARELVAGRPARS